MMLRLDGLIRRKATGTADDLAERLGVSVPTVYRYMRELRNFGAPISYCPQRHCYFYEEEFRLQFN